jgi:hypothetical protein
VYAVTPPAAIGGAWSEAILHSYGSAGDGGYLDGSLVADSAGVLFGTTGRVDCLQQPAGDGTVFSLYPPATPGGNWTNTVLYRFLDGFPANGNLLLGAGGTFYGTTAGACGAPDYGTVFALSSNQARGALCSWSCAMMAASFRTPFSWYAENPIFRAEANTSTTSQT